MIWTAAGAVLLIVIALVWWQSSTLVPKDGRPLAARAEAPHSPGRLGTYHYPLTPGELKAYGVSESGAVVVGVFPHTAAAEGGLKPGDVILELDGKPIRTDDDVVNALNGHFAGDRVKLMFSRRGEKSRVVVQLSPAPENVNAETFDAAESGLAWAQFDIGRMYESGKGVKKDATKARYWYEKAANSGFASAQFGLGQMWERGDGGATDLAKARDSYERAAAQDHAESEYRLAQMYAGGRGGLKSDESAARWYEKAAGHGQVGAEVALADMYATGRGLAKNESKAADLYEQAAKAGSIEGMAGIGHAYFEEQGVSQNFDNAIRWLKPAAEAGLARAQHDFGMIYYQGKGVPADHAVGAKWLTAAAEQGFVDSQALLAVFYNDDTDPPQYDKAFYWAKKAAEGNSPVGLAELGQMYRLGHGVKKNPAKAFECARKAAVEAGFLGARIELAADYSDGIGVARDASKAVELLLPIAENGDGYNENNQRAAQHNLGCIYYNGGKHLPKNADQGIFWWEKAARAGLVEAQFNLASVLRDKRRYEEAVTWFRSAAENGYPDAQNELGRMYEQGLGLPASRKDAIAWYLRSYQQGNTYAKANLKRLGVDAK